MLAKRKNFISDIIERDLDSKKHTQIITRFPPEPNGYLHIGHAKSICLNFGLAETYQGKCFLRLDDTNPTKEEEEYAKAIIEDVEWLGFKWTALTHASDYYPQLYEYALTLIKQGDAYVDSLSLDEIREHRGTLQEPGKASPYRNRSIEENINLFQQMKAGKFSEGAHVLRAKIDMAAGNINLRDPVLYRIRFVSHPRTKDSWCIYPMYDFAHPLSDAIEGVTHSICTLEFQDHRPLYDWFIHKLNPVFKPRQIEFARLNVSHTITSKRKLRRLVEEGYVSGWDDPRMPTLQGMRARGIPPEAIRLFCEDIGVSKSDSIINIGVLEECVRGVLNKTAERAMCVIKPLKVIIENFPDQEELLEAPCHPQDTALGNRKLYFQRELYIEHDDFMENPPKKYFRLAEGQEVRLRHAYVIKCEKVIKNDKGEVTELRCTYNKDTLGKNPEGRKVQGVIHWVPANAIAMDIKLYDRLFTVENPGMSEDFTEFLNKDSLKIETGCLAEPSLADSTPGKTFQFERVGYFFIEAVHGKKMIAHRIVSLKDTWKK